jgi:hypothetical protein
MTLLRGDLQEFLTDNVTIAALIGNRCYPDSLPQSVTYPALTYSEVSGVRVRDLDGPTGRARLRISIHSWAETSMQREQLADAVRTALDGYAGAMEGTSVGNVICENEFNIYEPDVPVYRKVQDYIISLIE